MRMRQLSSFLFQELPQPRITAPANGELAAAAQDSHVMAFAIRLNFCD
jgi:hypothetical protein